MQIDASGLQALRDHARRAETLDRWSDLACEWAGAAEAEIVRLRAERADLLAACQAAMEVFRDFDLGHLVAFEQLDSVIEKATCKPA